MTLALGDSTQSAAPKVSARHRVEERGGRPVRSRLVSASALPRFEFLREDRPLLSGADRLYRSSRAWFTPAAFKRRIGVDVPVFERLGMSYVPASQPSGARGLGGC